MISSKKREKIGWHERWCRQLMEPINSCPIIIRKSAAANGNHTHKWIPGATRVFRCFPAESIKSSTFDHTSRKGGLQGVASRAHRGNQEGNGEEEGVWWGSDPRKLFLFTVCWTPHVLPVASAPTHPRSPSSITGHPLFTLRLVRHDRREASRTQQDGGGDGGIAWIECKRGGGSLLSLHYFTAGSSRATMWEAHFYLYRRSRTWTDHLHLMGESRKKECV